MAIKIAIPKPPPAPQLPPERAADFSLVQAAFPNVGGRIAAMWGSAALSSYLDKLILDERGGRQGFPMPVIEALLRLYEYHGNLVPVLKPETNWEDAK